MCDFTNYLLRKQPLIARGLSIEISGLPASIRPVARHVLESGGKRLRPALVMLFAEALGNAGPDVVPLACALELLQSFVQKPVHLEAEPAYTQEQYDVLIG